jgi:transposase-like protein
MDKIATTKRAVQHKAWAEMYATYQESGKTVREWCSEQGIVTKTFYYRLRRLREEALEQAESHQIVPIATNFEMPSVHKIASIKIQSNGITIELPENICAETITAILRGLR